MNLMAVMQSFYFWFKEPISLYIFPSSGERVEGKECNCCLFQKARRVETTIHINKNIASEFRICGFSLHLTRLNVHLLFNDRLLFPAPMTLFYHHSLQFNLLY